MADFERALVVHAHPEPQSFSSALFRQSVQTLQALGTQVATSDLYAMGWNPVASARDFASRADQSYLNYALEQRHASRHGGLAEDIRSELDKLMACDLLVLNFPLYWFSTPALLKGWIDRVLVSGVCYGGKRFYDRGGLAGKAALVCVTLGGREHMHASDASVHGRLDDMLRPLLRGTLAYVGFRVFAPFVAWHVPYIEREERAAMLPRCDLRLRGLAREQALPFPSLSAFDERLYPLAPVI